MQIKLYIDGSQKTFTVPFIKARMLRRSIELQEQMKERSDGKKASLQDIDDMVDFVVELFNGQFSVDELWDGLSTEEFMPEIKRCMNEAVKFKGTQNPDPNVRRRSR